MRFNMGTGDVRATTPPAARLATVRFQAMWTGRDQRPLGSGRLNVTGCPAASSTWAMMLAGFMGLCIAGYRASRKTSAVASVTPGIL
jgi:hypothetical protein